jgi:hypothetical protein
MAANIDIEGNVTAPGGNLTFEAYDISPNVSQALSLSATATTPTTDLSRGEVTLGGAASLNVAGLTVDYRPNSKALGVVPLVITGGTVVIKSLDANLIRGSSVNVSGGVSVSATGKTTYGKAGSIQIQTGQDINIPSVLGGGLVLNARLLGYSGNNGGSLTIQAPLVQIGGTTSKSDTLLLSPDFFSQGGFDSFTINGLGAATSITDEYIPGFVIAAGTLISPVVQSYLFKPDGAGNGGLALATMLLPQGSRQPVSLNFGAVGVYDNFLKQMIARGDFVMESDSIIKTDPLGSVTIKAQTAAVLGSFFAPGGNITITGGSSFASLTFYTHALPTVDIGPDSVLSTAGTTVLISDPRGYRTGSVLSGGNISISGNIVAEAGSVLDTSGKSGLLDLQSVKSGQTVLFNPSLLVSAATYIPTVVESDAGSITLNGGQELFTDAKLIGNAGGSSARGGTLTLSSGIFLLPGATQTPLNVSLELTQSGPDVTTPFYSQGQTAIGNTVLGAGGTTPSGGHFATESFNQSGFGSLILKGTVEFSGVVSINAPSSISIAGGGVLMADPAASKSSLNLVSPYVDLGAAFQTPVSSQQVQTPAFQVGGTAFNFNPVYGSAVLTVVSSDLIDIGNLSLQNIGNANFIANNGDIRGDGTLDVAGDIYMRAGQIYPPTEVSFNIMAYDHGGVPGSVSIATSGSRQLPLSAGGQLNIFASIINQGGVLRAPLGNINLGWDGKGSAPIDLFTGNSFIDPINNAAPPITQTLTLSAGSQTSVSAVDPSTGQGIIIPYGTNPSGTAWIDPSGTDITATGPTAKAIHISAKNVNDQSGSSIDISGGGDLYAYRWVSGLGGTNDILASTKSFAVIPGYQSDFAPVDSVYSSAGLSVGDRVYLNASSGLAAGIYTLLPARYALLYGAYLVTPQSGTPTAKTIVKSDGSSLVSGYRFNDLGSTESRQPLSTQFEVASQTVVRARAEYDNYYANSFFTQNAQTSGSSVPRLPVDAGQLVMEATQSMVIAGSVTSQTSAGGRGSLVDISSPVDIVIAAPGAADPNPGNDLVLNASGLSAFGAESLLIGGVRQTGMDGTSVVITTKNLTVNNAGAALTGSDIILVAETNLTVAPNADIEQKGTLLGSSETLLLNGNGNLLRMSADPSAQIIRSGVTPSVTVTGMSIGASAKISGAGIILDSTYATTLDPSAILSGQSITLDSSRISLNLVNLPLNQLQGNPGLVLSNATLSGLGVAAQSLSLLSYSSIDIYGTGQVGALNSTGQPVLTNLALHTAEISGFDSNGNPGGGAVVFAARSISLDNAGGGVGLGRNSTAAGTISFNAGNGNISIGATAQEFNGYVGTVNSNIVTVSSNAGLAVGQEVLGTGIASGTTITAINGTAVTLSQATTITNGVTESLTVFQPLNIDQYAGTTLAASGGILFKNTGGLSTQGSLMLTTPSIAGTSLSNLTVTSNGALTVTMPTGSATGVGSSGLGAGLTLQGLGITVNSNIILPSGSLTLHATGGDLLVGNVSPTRLDVGGTSQSFFDLLKYTGGGQINITSDTGNVQVSAASTITVAAQPLGGNAGSLTISAPFGKATLDGTMLGQRGTGGNGGTFSLDAGSIEGVSTIQGVSLALMDVTLNAGGFDLSRSIRIRNGSIVVDDSISARSFNLSLDNGGITVTGTGVIDASGATGGSIALYARDNLILESGAELTVAGLNFGSAGKGGSVDLETTDGRITIGTVKNAVPTIDLSVAGGIGGTLHLRAPQVDSSNNSISINGSSTPVDLAIDALGAGGVANASSIIAEGYYAQDALTPGVAAIDNLESTAQTNATNFMANWSAIQTRLLSANPGLANVLNVQPGEEIDNTLGSLVLNNDWDFSTASWRFGAQNTATNAYTFNTITVGVEPGMLTLRAKDSIILNGSLSDGFGDGYGSATLPTDVNGLPALWLASLLPAFQDGSAQQSWSYRLTSGADFAASDYHQVQTLSALNAAGITGSIQIGVNGYLNNASPTGANAVTDTAIEGHYQVIRTGTGVINISSGRNIQLLNQFATIYTAGAQVADTTLGGTFQTPLNYDFFGLYPAQYSQGGGSVNIIAQGDIEHQTRTVSDNSLVPDSEKELPTDWLYRRGYVDATGDFGYSLLGDVASTTWWIDFSNFFEGVGALGGGNVTMIAGHNISNVDVVVPTNARMPGTDTLGNPVAPNSSALVELGGGDLVVSAGNNIDGGVYYVERGQGTLTAGNIITTNSTRSPSVTQVASPTYSPAATWLPTTLFLGDGSFDVSAGGDVLLGPAANPFLLPQGVNNTVYYKTYFSTYATSDIVSVSSLGGSVTLRESATLPTIFFQTNLLQAWLQNVLLKSSIFDTSANYQPWLSLAETSVSPFSTFSALSPASLSATSFTGDINLDGALTLSPSSTGTVDFTAAGSINGLQSNGVATVNGKTVTAWGSGSINLSDANPGDLPGVATPDAYQAQIESYIASHPTQPINPEKAQVGSNFLDFSSFSRMFNETGSTTGSAAVLQTQLALHASINGQPLHAGDTIPVYLYARTGDIADLTLFSAKAARVVAGYDLTDIALYVQNVSADDVSVVSAGHDIIAYDLNSPLLLEANAFGNALEYSAYTTYHSIRTATVGSDGKTHFVFPTVIDGQAGDIQISGPGTLEVTAGRNLDLGIAPTNWDGTSLTSNGPADGLTSIGNARNPILPFEGADIIAGAGIGIASGLNGGQIDFKSFISTIVNGTDGATYLSELSGISGLNVTTISEFNKLSVEQQDIVALDMFYLALRDAGRKHSSTGNYNEGYAAISALFPGSQWKGDITTRSRDILTANGGNISLFAPGGSLTLETIATGNPLTPPGVITEHGGNISIFTNNDVNIGISRIFTLRGGNEIIWSTNGNIAAGSSSKTVQSAPPTRVLIDPQSGDVKTDLAGLATGGGIGVLDTVTGVAPGNVDLIAPNGTVDAGDAGIRSSGNLTIAAVQVLNASNISAGGTSTGTSVAVSATNIGGLTSAASTGGAANAAAADQAAANRQNQSSSQQETPSIITVEVLGFGDGPEGQNNQGRNEERKNEMPETNVAGI